jgi:hypothetical protein
MSNLLHLLGEHQGGEETSETDERKHEQAVRMQCAGMALSFGLNVLAHTKTAIDITRTAEDLATFVLHGAVRNHPGTTTEQ